MANDLIIEAGNTLAKRINKFFKGNYLKFYGKYLDNITEVSAPDLFKAQCPLCSEGILCFNNRSGMWSCSHCQEDPRNFIVFYLRMNKGNIKEFPDIQGCICVDHAIRPVNFEEFPLWVISGVAGTFTKLYGKHLESPWQFFYFCFLTIFGLLLSDNIYKLVPTLIKAQTRLYVILLGTSATARKSTAINMAVELFRSWGFFDPLKGEDRGMKIGICEGAASGEGVARLLEEERKGLLVYDELKAFQSKANIQQATLLSHTNTFFDRNRIENMKSEERKSVLVEDGYLALLAACTTDTYINLFDAKYTDIGFTNRLFIVPGTSDKIVPFPDIIPERDMRYLKIEFDKRIEFFWTLLDSGKHLRFEGGARAKWEKYYTEMKRRRSLHTKRLGTYGFRLMCLLTINDLKSSIDIVTVNKVIALLEWQFKMRQLYDPIACDDKVAKMEEKIRRKTLAQAEWKQWELQRAVNYTTDGLWVWENARDNLIKNGEILLTYLGKTPMIKRNEHYA